MSKRRRRSVGLAVVVAAVWVWLGFPGVPMAEEGRAVGQQPADTSPVARIAGALPVAAPSPPSTPSTPTTAEAPDAAAEAVLAGDAPGRGEVELPADPESASTRADPALADKVGGLLFTIEAAIATGQLGLGWRRVHEIEALAVPDAMVGETARARERLVQAQTAALEELAGAVEDGRILEARRVLGRMRDPEHPDVEAALRTLSTARGWPALARGPVLADHGIAAPAGLARDRRVRMWRGDACVIGEVAATAGPGDEVSVRVRHGRRVEFSFVACSALEPVDASRDEALDAARTAVCAGDAALAALWLCRVASRGGLADDPAAGALVAALRPAAGSSRDDR